MVNGYILRFLGFLFYILNIMNKNDGVFCYKVIILNLINIICEKYVSGRIVIYYNNRIDFLFLYGYFI